MPKQYLIRSFLTLTVFALLYLAIAAKLFYWQVVKAQDLKKLRDEQSIDAIQIPSIRGEIRTSDNFPLATNTISYLLYANPKVVFQKDQISKKVAEIIKTDQASVSAQLAKEAFWVKIASGLSFEQKEKIEMLKLKGFGFQDESTRYYPEASTAAHLVGFLGKKENGESKGYFGIEGFYNEQLAGRDGKLFVVRDALGNETNDIREEKKVDGRSVVLTIDRFVQYAATKRLLAGVEKYNADGGTVIVMEPKSGKILAMTSFPRFDPQKYYESSYETYTNPAISNLYEPGSTFKVLIMASGIDSGKVKPSMVCDSCGGPVQIGEYSVKTWNNKYFNKPTMNDVIVHSDNTGMVFVGRKMGLSILLSYFNKFGIGKLTGIDLQGEASSTLRAENLWYPIDLATTTFGQGIIVTPIQLLNAVSSIANEGKLMKPYVVGKIIYDEREIDVKPEFVRKTISEAAAKTVASMMVSAVEQGEAKWVKIKGYQIAGKTGTAQIPLAGHYDPNQTIASFVGFFPAKDPKISMLVLINRPKTSIYGAETAAPVFFSIAKDLIHYYNIAPN